MHRSAFVVHHRGGNDLALLRSAPAAGLSMVEADLHLHRGRVEVRHLKTMGPIPLLWDRWRLASGLRTRLLLDDVLRSVQPDTRLLLDLKGRDVRLSQHVLDALRCGDPRGTIVCSRTWRLLEPFSGSDEVRVLHSIGSRRQLRAFLRHFAPRASDGVSIHARLLDPAVVGELRQRVDVVFSWPVDTLARARELATWGVSGMISNRPLLAGELSSAGAVASRPS